MYKVLSFSFLYTLPKPDPVIIAAKHLIPVLLSDKDGNIIGIEKTVYASATLIFKILNCQAHMLRFVPIAKV